MSGIARSFKKGNDHNEKTPTPRGKGSFYSQIHIDSMSHNIPFTTYNMDKTGDTHLLIYIELGPSDT